jgi:hypothetical protein
MHLQNCIKTISGGNIVKGWNVTFHPLKSAKNNMIDEYYFLREVKQWQTITMKSKIK